jgi:DNA-binding NarL/FixJ family response regulator
MAKGRAVAIVLEAAEKNELTALTRKHGAPQALAERARIVIAAASGLNNKEIAAKVGVCAATVGPWRNRAGWMVSTMSRALARRARSATMR